MEVAAEDQGCGGDREQDDHGEVEAFADAAAAECLGEVVDEAEGEEAGDGGEGPEGGIRVESHTDDERQGHDRAADERQPATGAGGEGDLAGLGLGLAGAKAGEQGEGDGGEGRGQHQGDEYEGQDDHDCHD